MISYVTMKIGTQINNAFLKLSYKEQAEIIATLAPQLKRDPQILEKDIWVCWVLQKLFDLPNSLPMVFKGGTSLSKVFNLIKRFSEDIDISIDYRAFNNDIKLPIEKLSKTAQKKFSEKLKTDLIAYVNDVIKPHFQKISQNELNNEISISISEDGEKFRIHYPSSIYNITYISSSVLIEFGARNITEPKEYYQIKPDIAHLLPQLNFPTPNIPVLSPLQTFWEKTTLIHVECNRGELRKNSDRLSRHWYDLVMLSNHHIGAEAILNRDLLCEVIHHKKIFFNTAYANYDACLTGNFKLLPNPEQLQELQQDYQKMVTSGMFYESPPSFSELIKKIKEIEYNINT